jgi:serine/threonine protein phosphatase PrpC
MLRHAAALTDPGRKRRRNEDAFVCAPPLFAVADGMGGAQAGEIASRLAAAAVQRREPAGSPGREEVVALIEEANRAVFERASLDEAASGMGTTLTIALLGEEEVWIGHVGDSRAYLLRQGELRQLTDDHSLVAELVRSGRLSREEAESHPQRSVITRALGTEQAVEVDAFSVPVRPGDLFLLCSDGLTSMVEDDAIRRLLEASRPDLEQAARALVEEANRRGGEDNITVVLFELAGLEDTVELPGMALEQPLPDSEQPPSPSSPAPTSSPAPSRRRRRLRFLLLAASLLALLVVAAVLALSRLHFVGAEENGHVAVYQGLPWELAPGIRLYRLVYESPLLAAYLTRAERQRLFDHDLVSRGKALREVSRYERQVAP